MVNTGGRLDRNLEMMQTLLVEQWMFCSVVAFDLAELAGFSQAIGSVDVGFGLHSTFKGLVSDSEAFSLAPA